ncbi:hypothetical protein R6Q59_012402 [Mikania micrantha]
MGIKRSKEKERGRHFSYMQACVNTDNHLTFFGACNITNALLFFPCFQLYAGLLTKLEEVAKLRKLNQELKRKLKVGKKSFRRTPCHKWYLGTVPSLAGK